MLDGNLPPVAQLSPDRLAKVQEVERRLGDVYVVAYEPPVKPAPLTPEQVQAIQQAEKDTGLCLIAYSKSGQA